MIHVINTGVNIRHFTSAIMAKSRLPVLIIIPHGGQMIPDELSGYEQIDRFGVFIDSDSCANQLFNFTDAAEKIDTYISRLFVDTDRSPLALPARTSDGVIKKESISGRKIFEGKAFPDNIAISNILRRYHFPFHEEIRKFIKNCGIKFILECHTMMPVGQRNAPDSGSPRPLVSVSNISEDKCNAALTCPDRLARAFLERFSRPFSNENYTVASKLKISKEPGGYIMEKYGTGNIPMLRLSVSTSLFLNDEYFNYDYLTVDENRIDDLRQKIWTAIEGFVTKDLKNAS